MHPTPEPSPAGRKLPLQAVRILLVEDDRDTAGVFEEILGQAGATVVVAASAAAAVTELERGGFDLVVSDYALGQGPNGFQLMQQIRSQPADARIPIIGYSAHAGQVPTDQQAEFTVYAPKPAVVEQIVALARAAVQGRPRQDAPAPGAGPGKA